ncbi:response regulator [Desulfocurvibacter africanus]|uniref:response regulator n=1 Tax=Desulfocurvibacter africanus TaxID=873 RepID=UPI002FDA974B
MSARTILIIEDEMHMRRFLGTLFEMAGFESLLARNGEEGIKAARTRKPGIILLDMMMPRQGGLVMYRQLKAEPDLAAIPVVVLSGVPRDTALHALPMIAAIDGVPLPEPEAYLEKPPKPDELVPLIERIMLERDAARAGNNPLPAP